MAGTKKGGSDKKPSRKAGAAKGKPRDAGPSDGKPTARKSMKKFPKGRIVRAKTPAQEAEAEQKAADAAAAEEAKEAEEAEAVDESSDEDDEEEEGGAGDVIRNYENRQRRPADWDNHSSLRLPKRTADGVWTEGTQPPLAPAGPPVPRSGNGNGAVTTPATTANNKRSRADEANGVTKRHKGEPSTVINDQDDDDDNEGGDAAAADDIDEDAEDDDDEAAGAGGDDSKRGNGKKDKKGRRGRTDRPELSAAELEVQKERRFERMKGEIAEVCENILENPEKNVFRWSKLAEMLNDADVRIQHLSMGSMTEVFRDIMPGYRIRLPTELEMKAKVTKEQKKLRQFEASMLAGYQRLVSYLIDQSTALFRKAGQKKELPKTALVVVMCLCRLLERGYQFNFRKDLVDAVVPLLNNPIAQVRQQALACIRSVFGSDVGGDCALEAVRHITRIVKSKGAKVRGAMLEGFLSLPLSKEIVESEKADVKKDKRSYKKKYLNKEQTKEMVKDLATGEAEVSVDHKRKAQTAILTEVITCYFRVLKQQQQSRILPTVLKGLAKFSHLINGDLVLDLLECLKVLIHPSAMPQLSVESALHCITTAFATLRTHTSTLAIDLKEFYTHLYALLWRLAEPANYQHISLALHCVDVMFQHTRQLALDRVASFTKRLASLCLYVPPYAALGILHSLRACFLKYPKTKQLLDREVTTSGAYLADLDDPDHANAFAATAWEFSMLKVDYHPYLPKYVTNLLDGGQLSVNLSRSTPTSLLAAYDTSSGEFNPPMTVPPAVSKTQTKKDRLKRKVAMRAAAIQDNHSAFLASLLPSGAASATESKSAAGSSSSSVVSMDGGAVSASFRQWFNGNLEHQLEQRIAAIGHAKQQAALRRKASAAATPAAKKTMTSSAPTASAVSSSKKGSVAAAKPTVVAKKSTRK